MIKKKLVLEAVSILRDLNKKYYDDCSKKKPLLEGEDQGVLFLQVNLKKIPQNKAIKMIKVPLPHSLRKDSDEVCLITGDLDKKNHKAEIEPDVIHYKQLLSKHGITCISEVVTLRQLRTDYKPFEAKQNLLAAYDMFLTDNKIAGCLPRVLGKHFFRKRKFPIQINMKTSNLKQQIEKALSTQLFSVTGRGNTCCSEIAYLDMKDSEIFENIAAMAKILSSNLPGLWNNVMGVYLRTSKSQAIPLYMSYDNPNDVHLEEEVEDSPVIDELSTLINVNVKVFSDGRIKKAPIRGDNEGKNNQDLKEESPEPMIETKKSVKGKSERNLEVNVPNSVKETKKSKKSKKDLAEAENDSENQSEEEFQNAEQLNSQELEKETKRSKNELHKKQLPAPNDSESESTAVRRSKRKKPEVCLTSNESSLGENSDQVKSEELVKEAKQSKKKKVLAKMQLLPVSDNSGSERSAVNKGKKKKTNDCVTSNDCSLLEKKSTKQVNLKEKGTERPKRKRTESKSEAADNVQNVSDNEMSMQSMQALKKRKVEGMNMKRYNARKESLKNKKKKNNPRQKI